MLLLIFIVSLLNSGSTSFWHHRPAAFSYSSVLSTEFIVPGHDTPTAINNDVTIEDNFATQLSAITQDVESDFKNIKSTKDQDGSKDSRTRYYSLVLLEGAIQSFIEEDSVTGYLVFEARYPGSTVPEYTQQIYEMLKDNISYVNLSSCLLMEDKETINGNIRSQFYLAYLVRDQPTPKLIDLVVEVAIFQEPGVGVGGETIVWVPVLKVYGK